MTVPIIDKSGATGPALEAGVSPAEPEVAEVRAPSSSAASGAQAPARWRGDPGDSDPGPEWEQEGVDPAQGRLA